MKKISTSLAVLFSLILQKHVVGQCASNATLGTSSNMFTHVINSTNPVAANKALNTVVFIHRNDAGLLGGNSGQLRYDLSTNNGSTWTTNQGVLNPIGTSLARYPNVAIYNPPLNTTPTNAYLLHMCATINGAAAWNGNVTGARQLSGTGNTESYNQPAGPLAYIPRNIVKGAPGVFWAIDAQWGTNVQGFNVYKGTWSTAVNDIVWATNYTVAPTFNMSYASFAFVGNDYSIAFDPTGQYGWFSFLGHVTPGPANYSYYPVLYKTTDGGLTWTGPITADLNTFGCITGNIVGNATANTEHDLVVDSKGNPHIFTTLGGGTNYSLNYNGWHHMYDITLENGIWTGYDVGNVNGAGYTWGVNPNYVTQYQNPQAARSADGNKVFFTWTDNSTYALGALNQTPNLFGRAYDIMTKQWTVVKDFTSCNAPIAGTMLFPHVAEEVLEPTNTTFKLATVYAQAVTPGDPGLTASFRFLDNITFTTTEFSIPNPTIGVSIAQGTSALVCSTGSVNLTGSGFYDLYQWSNGVQTSVNPVNIPGVYTLTAMSACIIGTTSINVMALNASIGVPAGPACEGVTTTLTATGNAYSYNWLPDNTTGNTTTVTPLATTVYTLEAFGTQNCVNTVTFNLVVSPVPSLTVTGASSVCAGSAVTQTVSGAVNYNWVGVGSGAVISLSPAVATTYTVVGTDANLCSNTKMITINVVPTPTVSASATKMEMCAGQVSTITANGALSYSLTSAAGSTALAQPVAAVMPNTTTSYTVTGMNAAGCTSSYKITITIALCTGIDQISATENSGLMIYPNPNNGDFTIAADLEMILHITNELGQLVKTVSATKANDYKVPVSDLANGVYFVSGRNGEKAITLKVVVAR